MDGKPDIEALIARVALNDRDAFSILYDATSAKLFGVCLRVLNDRAAAEEALQDIYVKVWNRAGRYRVTGHSPMTWLITVARNTAIDRLRKAPRETDGLDDLAVAAPGPDGEESAIAAGEARRIRECMDELEADRAAAVRAVYLEGRSYAEMAERYSVPLNTMKTWLRRSLISLKECLSQ